MPKWLNSERNSQRQAALHNNTAIDVKLRSNGCRNDRLIDRAFVRLTASMHKHFVEVVCVE